MEIPKELMISISGIRGHAPEKLSPALAYAFTLGFSKSIPSGPIVVSRDSRASGFALKAAVLAALAEEGRTALDADLIPLPTTQIAVREFKAAGGIDVTASHNPIEYNGLKFLNGEGEFVDKTILEKVRTFIEALPEETAVGEKTAQVKNIQEEAMRIHLDKVKATIFPGRKLIVALDATNGAGSFIVPKFLEEIGCEVVPIATDPSQPFPHIPEPKPENLVWTQEKLQGLSYDLCVVVDPDADRLVLIDEAGNLLHEETTLPLVLQEMIAEGKQGKVVINLSTSRMTEDVAEGKGVTVLRAPVGEANVVALMKKEQAFFGGEGSGGIINPTINYGRDCMAGIVAVISLMRRTGKKLSELANELPKYEMSKTKFDIEKGADYNMLYEKIIVLFPEASINREDGLRLAFPDKTWVHIRPSNTEPILRLFGETNKKEVLDEISVKIKELLK